MKYPLLNVFLTMMWLFLWALWFVLLFYVITDVFRDDKLSGWAKAGWTVFVIVLPFAGVLTYLIVRGAGMGERQAAWRRAREARYYEAARQNVAPATTGKADELARLAELKEHGDLTPEEFTQAKAKVLTG
jgi:Short C-terminal domain/Phospholipase_D-nuclease N-terminal